MSTAEAPEKSGTQKKGAGAAEQATPAPEETAPEVETTEEPVAEEPKVYVFGGSTDAPELGANSRRLWLWCTENLSKKNVKLLRREVLKAQSELKVPDRFVRWQRIVAVAEKLGITGKDGSAINQALVRRLQAEDKGGEIGRNTEIHIA
jgi:hypothetical protein